MLIITRFNFPQTHLEVNNTVVTKVRSGLTCVGINSNKTTVTGREEQTLRAD